MEKENNDIFSRFSVEETKEMMKHQKMEFNENQKQIVIFAFIQIRDESFEILSKRIEEVLDIVETSEFIIDDMNSSIFMLHSHSEKASIEDVIKLSHTLISTFSNNIKIIYGRYKTFIAPLGNRHFQLYQPIFINIERIFKGLFDLKFGEYLEMDAKVLE